MKYPYTPVSEVQVLSEQFNGRLRTVDLLGRHVEVVHKNDGLTANRRSEHTLPTLVQLRHDNVL